MFIECLQLCKISIVKSYMNTLKAYEYVYIPMKGYANFSSLYVSIDRLIDCK